MTTRTLAPPAQALLSTALDSFEKLEVLRVLRASKRAMSADELEAACRLGPDTVRETLGSLADVNILERVGDGRMFRVSTAAPQPGLEALMATYEEDRSAVLGELSKLAIQRIRSMTATAFADAFVIRKRGSDDG